MIPEDAEFKEVSFYLYCPKCRHAKKDEKMDPCNECLEWSMREGTEKPIYYEEG